MSCAQSKTGITRREFGALAAESLVAATTPSSPSAQARTGQSPPGVTLDIADWSYYWYGIERVKLARGTLVNGTQMFVEHWIPMSSAILHVDPHRHRRGRSGENQRPFRGGRVAHRGRCSRTDAPCRTRWARQRPNGDDREERPRGASADPRLDERP